MIEMRFLDLHTHHPPDDPGILAIPNRYPDSVDAFPPYFSVGIHPWYVQAETLSHQIRKLQELAARPECLAIGECGLDKKTQTGFSLQREAFEKQIGIARELGKPLILHCVAAFQEVTETISASGFTGTRIIHGFSKKAEMAQQLLRSGFHLSFGAGLLKNPELAAVLADVPDDRFFLETDASAENIRIIYEKAALAKGRSVDEIKAITARNFHEVFGIKA